MSLTDTFDNPQSRVEAILQNAMGAEHEVVPQSRVEELLERLDDYLENIEGKITEQDEEIIAAVNAWLEDNPEATTTVQDGSLTEAKFSNALKLKAIKDYVTPEMYGAKGDGLTDDTSAIQECFDRNDFVALYGKYLVSSELTVRSGQHLEFHDGTIIASENFDGDCVIRIVDNGKYGSLINVSIDGNKNNIFALLVEKSNHLVIENFHSIRCYGGGITVQSGYEFMLNGFSIVYDNSKNITAQAASAICGIKLRCSDSEIVQGNCINYPVGCDLYSQTRAVSVHCWGMPNAANHVGGFMLIGFVCFEKQNTLIGCVSDTPTLLDANASPSVSNGGIGFLDANTSYSAAAYPTESSYIGCNVIVHAASVNESVICFHLGDANNNSSTGTTILSATYSGTASKVKELVHFAKESIKTQCNIFGNHFLSTDINNLGWQGVIRSNEYKYARNDYAGLQTVEKVATKKVIYRTITPNTDILIAENVTWLHFNDMYLATAVKNITSRSAGKIEFTANATYTTGLSENTDFVFGQMITWEGTLDLKIKRIGNNFYIHCDDASLTSTWVVIEITVGEITH